MKDEREWGSAMQAELGMPEGGLVGSASVSCNAAQTCNICCFGVVVL